MRQKHVNISLDEIVDREKIRHNLALYCRGMDRQDKDLLGSTYWPDGWDDHGLFEGSGIDFGEFMIPVWPKMKMQHLLGQSCIEVHGNFANAETYFFAYHRLGEAGATKDVLLGGRYNDRLEKRGDVWKILHRVVALDWWQDSGASAPWDGWFWNGRTMPERTYGSTDKDYSWDLFANVPFRKSLETGSRTRPNTEGAA
jgi:hypothetical protein